MNLINLMSNNSLSDSVCTKCEEGKILDKRTGLCSCSRGFKEDPVDGNCLRCFYFKGKCIEKCPPFTNVD